VLAGQGLSRMCALVVFCDILVRRMERIYGVNRAGWRTAGDNICNPPQIPASSIRRPLRHGVYDPLQDDEVKVNRRVPGGDSPPFPQVIARP
jgi:hypothetical protein